MSYVSLSFLFMIMMLLILTAAGRPSYAESISVDSNQEAIVPFCSMKHPEFQNILYVIHAIDLGMSLKLCWSIRDVPKKFSDFHSTSF
jgi:hypothetical protein